MRLPLIVFWEFNHFLVVEGFGKNRVYLNDPASGPRTVTDAEFDQAFTGVVLELEPGSDFKRGGTRRSLFGLVSSRLAHSRSAVAYLLLTGLALVLLGLVIRSFSRIFIDRILVDGQSWVWPLLAGMALTALLRAAVTGLEQHYLLRLEARLAVGMASAFVWHILRLPVEFFTQRDPCDVSSRVALNDRVRLLAVDLANAVLNIIVIVFYIAVMLQYDLPLTLLGVLTAVSNLVILRYVACRRVDDSQRLQLARSKLVSATIGGLQNIETIKSTSPERLLCTLGRPASEAHQRAPAGRPAGADDVDAAAGPDGAQHGGDIDARWRARDRKLNERRGRRLCRVPRALITASFLAPVDELVNLAACSRTSRVI